MKNATEIAKLLQRTLKEKVDEKCKNCLYHFTGGDCDDCESRLVKGVVHKILRIEFDIPNDRDLPKKLFHFINTYGQMSMIINPSKGMIKTLNKLVYKRASLVIPENKECKRCKRIVKPSLLMKEEGCWYCID